MPARATSRQVLLSTTMLVGALKGYARGVYAQCANAGGSNYSCSGANVTQQDITSDNATVSTVPGFSVNTGDARAVNITANGDLSYTDENASPLTAADIALFVSGSSGGTAGGVTVNTDGTLIGGARGIMVFNLNTGALTIEANGNVTGTSTVGIYAQNYGTSLAVTTGAGTTVTGGAYGIAARNSGSEALTIEANGNVTGTADDGIYARNEGTSLAVTTAAGTAVTGSSGINARNYGSEALTIEANGNVTGTTGYGINAQNGTAITGAGTDLTVTTAAGTTITSGDDGVDARNYGSGATTIAINGNITSGGNGVRTKSFGTGGFSLTTGAGSTISGTAGGGGIYAENYSGAMTFAINGDVIGDDRRRQHGHQLRRRHLCPQRRQRRDHDCHQWQYHQQR